MTKPVVYYDPRGPSGNIFAVAALVTKALRVAGKTPEQIREIQEGMVRAKSYEAALEILGRDVDLISVEER